MELENMVKVMEVSKIFPSSSRSLPLTFSLPLTDYDWIFVRAPRHQRLLFYPLSKDSLSLFESIIIPNLKLSLSLTLQHYFPLAGALVWPDDSPLPYILYSRDDAVCFTLAESLADFQTLSSPNPLGLRLFQSLFPSMNDFAVIPMCAIQVTHFQNHGYSIGLSTHHVIGDGQSFNLFLKSWAYICNKLNLHLDEPPTQDLPGELIPCFDRNGRDMISNPLDFVPENRNLCAILDGSPPSDWQRATLNLNQNDVEKLKRKALEYWTPTTTKEELHLSTFVVVYAHALVCLAKAKGEHECKDKFFLGLAVDARSRLSPPISTNYFGNCVVHKVTILEATELREDENAFSIVAKKIGDLILEVKGSSGGVEKPKPMRQIVKVMEEFEFCTVGSSPKFKIYETDFGWGNPKQAEMIPVRRNNFIFMDSAYGSGAIQLVISLPTHQMDVFASLLFKL